MQNAIATTPKAWRHASYGFPIGDFGNYIAGVGITGIPTYSIRLEERGIIYSLIIGGKIP